MSRRINAAVPRWDENNQRWILQIQIDGKRKTFTSSRPGKAGADEVRRKHNKWLANDLSMTDPRLRDVYPAYIEDIIARKGKQSNAYTSATRIVPNRILSELGHLKVSRITEQNLQDLLNNATPQKGDGQLSKKTVANIRGEISLFWKFLKRSGYVTYRPDTLEIPAHLTLKEGKTIFDREHMAVLLKDKTICPYIMAWQIMIMYGFRPGEVYGLKWQDISDDKIEIHRSIDYYGNITSGKNKNAIRVEAMIEPARKVFERAREWRKSCNVMSHWVFQGVNGNPPWGSYSVEKLHKYCADNNLPDITPYRLRHSFASIFKDILTEGQLKMVMGHSATMDTGVYMHRLKDDHLRIGEKLAATFGEILA